MLDASRRVDSVLRKPRCLNASDLRSGRTVGPLRALRIGPATGIKPEAVNSIRREFAPASVEKFKSYDQIRTFLRDAYPACGSEASFPENARRFLNGLPLLIIYEAAEHSVVESLKLGLGMATGGAVRDLVVNPGMKAQQWQEQVRLVIPSVGGIVYAYGNSLGRLNVPAFTKERTLVWKGQDMVSAMRGFYRATMCSPNEGAVAASRI